MRNRFRTVLTTTAVLATLAGGSILYAHAESPNPQSPGGMMGMMNMMGQMSQMMETCNNMMKQMPQHPGTERPEAGKNPEQKD